MIVQRVVREGFIAGCIGAGVVALWFLGVDLVMQRSFFTPAMLGSALFWGVRDPTAVQISFASVISYSMVHLVLFVLVGAVAAGIASVVEKFPSTMFLAVVFFAVFEIGFYILVVLLAQPLLRELAWFNVAIGNLIAALAMGYYLWRAHPQIHEALKRQPLGATVDGE